MMRFSYSMYLVPSIMIPHHPLHFVPGDGVGEGNQKDQYPAFAQALIGHNSLKTTEIYTHVAASSFNKIKNLLD